LTAVLIFYAANSKLAIRLRCYHELIEVYGSP